MKRVLTLLLTIMLTSLLAFSSATAASRESEGSSITWVIHNYLYALYGRILEIGDRLDVDYVNEAELLDGGDADDLAGGKTHGAGSESSALDGIALPEGSDNINKVTN